MPTRRLSALAVPIGVVSIVLLLVVPLPAYILDVLIAFNITLAIVVLLVAMSVKKPLDFSVFPSLLLVATLFRLALNVSATRLVLRTATPARSSSRSATSSSAGRSSSAW